MSSIKCHHEDTIAIAILSTDSIVLRKSYTEFQPFGLHPFSLARKLRKFGPFLAFVTKRKAKH